MMVNGPPPRPRCSPPFPSRFETVPIRTRQPYNHMSTQQFRETVALGHRRPHIERRWPRSIQRLLKRCWDRDPVARPSFGEILGDGTLEQVCDTDGFVVVVVVSLILSERLSFCR